MAWVGGASMDACPYLQAYCSAQESRFDDEHVLHEVRLLEHGGTLAVECLPGLGLGNMPYVRMGTTM